DFFLFYVFWELMLLPMYFLIGIWGAPSRMEADGRVRGGPYAAIKFFLYTLIGSVLLLVAILGFYFHDVPRGSGAAEAAVGGADLGGGSLRPTTFTAARSFDLMQLQR